MKYRYQHDAGSPVIERDESYGSALDLLAHAISRVDSSLGGWCEVGPEDKPTHAHPRIRAIQKGLEWVGPIPDHVKERLLSEAGK